MFVLVAKDTLAALFKVNDVSDCDACTTACSVNMVRVGGGDVLVGVDDVSVVVLKSMLDVDVGD